MSFRQEAEQAIRSLTQGDIKEVLYIDSDEMEVVALEHGKEEVNVLAWRDEDGIIRLRYL